MGGCCCKKKPSKTVPDDIVATPRDAGTFNNLNELEQQENTHDLQQTTMIMHPIIQIDHSQHEEVISNYNDKQWDNQSNREKQQFSQPKYHNTNQNPPVQKKVNQFLSYKFLPIRMDHEYRTKFKDLEPCPDHINDQCKEIIMTLNIARSNPKYFSNNVLEAVRDRLHLDKAYNSFSCGMIKTEEGLEAMDSLLDYICKQPKMPGLNYNHKVERLLKVNDIRILDVFNTNVFDIQEGEEQYLRERLEECAFNYEHLYVFLEFNTAFGFEVVCNLLRDDGNEEKDVRKVLLNPNLKNLTLFHEKHSTGCMITYLIVTSEEISQAEYKKLYAVKHNLISNDETQDQTMILKISKDDYVDRYKPKTPAYKKTGTRHLIPNDGMTEKIGYYDNRPLNYMASTNRYGIPEEEEEDSSHRQQESSLRSPLDQSRLDMSKSFQIHNHIQVEDVSDTQTLQSMRSRQTQVKTQIPQSQMHSTEHLELSKGLHNRRQQSVHAQSQQMMKFNPEVQSQFGQSENTNTYTIVINPQPVGIVEYKNQKSTHTIMQKYHQHLDTRHHHHKKESWELDSSQYYLNLNDKKAIVDSVDEMMNYRVSLNKPEF